MLRLIFVRHGRTPWNVQGRVQGGGALDEVGRVQAAALGERLSTEHIDAIYASPALRARQTARAVACRHGLPVRQRNLLRDLDYGRFAGALLADVREQQPGLIERWRDHPETVQFEDGERLSDLRRRIERFIAEVAVRHPNGTVLVATHDSPVRIAASLALGLDDSQHNKDFLQAPLTSVTEIEVDGGNMTLRVHNDFSHVRGGDGTT
jgi:probable phosphoglycerate mutase